MRFLMITLTLVVSIPAYADYNVTIGSGASANGAWSGASPDVWTPSASGATVSATEIETRLAAGTSVTITTAGGGAENGDITQSASLTWTTNTTLTFTALRNIAVNTPIAATGTSAGLSLGHGVGADYSINNGVKITLSGSSASLSIGGQAYTVINSVGVEGDATTSTLQGMKNNLTGKYALGADVDASATSGWNAGSGFDPIGHNFSGGFAGLGHVISGLVINRPGSSNVGLFARVNTDGAFVRDLGLRGHTIVGHSYTGGLVGQNWGTILNCYSIGDITAIYSDSWDNVGGLVGSSYAGLIKNSYSGGTVTGNDMVGGLVGNSSAGLPHLTWIGNTISNSYSTALVNGNTNVGGLIGSESGSTISDSYWDTQASGQATSAGGTGKTTAEMKQQATYANWDFDKVWTIDEGNGYPDLRGLAVPPVLSAVAISGTTQTATVLSATSHEVATGYWIVVARDAAAPTAAQVKAAATYSGVTLTASGNAAMTVNVAKNFSVSGLTGGTDYDLYFAAEDGSGNLVAAPVKVQFATSSADTTPDAYTFTAQTGAARSTVTPSNAITVAGINSAAAISITGGEYEINASGTWASGAGTVNNGDTVKVRLTSSASYSTAATATLTIGGVDGTFSVTTEAAPAPPPAPPPPVPSYDPPPPPPPPTTLTVSANGSGTLTGSITQVTVNGGGTLIIPATIAAAGVTLNLPAPSSGAASPVTLTLNGQSLNVTPGGAGTVLRVTTATVTLNGVPTVVQLISLSAGTITVSGSGQTLLSIGSGATPRLLASGGNEAVTALATLDAASGETLLAVSGGMVVLPAANTATRSAAATQTEIHAGETVTFDSAGQIKSHRAGSPSGSNGAGDPLTIANRPATLTLDATLSNLKGGLARLDGQSPEQAALALLGADFTLGNGGQTPAGVLPLTVGQTTLHLLPLGPLDIDASQPDGVSLTADGLYQFVRSGVVMQFAPSVRDSRQLAGDLASTFSGAATTVHNDGVIVVRAGGVDFVMQPDLSAESGSGNAMEFDFGEQGHLRYRDAQGYRQTLHPAFAELATLRDILTAAIPGIVVNRNNGVTTAAIGEVIYTLVPDYTLTSIPAEQAGRGWWSGADGKLYIRNADGTAQGFAVR
jgi:hypothetical protein